ncbi:MAG: hypothetical protein HS129_12125 [Leptospiraceae bacterium]|nr:hypothetical protein [Leptospiraceae bacterium]
MIKYPMQQGQKKIPIILFSIFIFLLFSQCQNKYEALKSDVDVLIENEKFDSAKEKIKIKLEGLKSTDEIISSNKPKLPRILEMSNDRNRIVWTEDKKIIFRDLANPVVKSKDIGELIEWVSVSSESEYAVLAIKLVNGSGCRLKTVSFFDSKDSYDSGAFVSCFNKGAISTEGTKIYYFVDDNLYQEETKEPKKPILVIPKEKLISPFPKLKNKFSMFPIGKTFLIFSGNAGSYYLYWFSPKSNSIKILAKDILSPKIFHSDGKSVYAIGGTVGAMLLREIKFTHSGEPNITKGLPISQNEINPWSTTKKNEFISGNGDSVYKWGPGKKKQIYPIICERFWGVARDHIIYENKKNELILANTEFSLEDWKILDLYKEVKKKKEK